MKGKGGAVWIARQCQQIFVAAIAAPDTCKAIMQDATVKIAINDLSHIGPEKTILLGKALIVDLFQRFKIVLNALIILRCLWFAWLIDGRHVGHSLFSLKGAG